MLIMQYPKRSTSASFRLLVAFAVLWSQLTFTSGGEQANEVDLSVERELLRKENWTIDSATILDSSNYTFIVNHAMSSQSDSIESVTLFDYDCVTPLDSNAILTTDSANNIKTSSDFTFVVDLDESFVNSSSPLIEFTASDPTNSTGVIKFCSNFERKLTVQGSVLPITNRKTKFSLSFSVGSNSFSVEPNIVSDDPDLVSIDFLDGVVAQACYCNEDSLDCLSATDIDVGQSQMFYICFTPPSQNYNISNMNVILSTPDNVTQYEPIRNGPDGPISNQLTTTSTGFQTGKTWETVRKGIFMVALFFETEFDAVIVSGTVNLNLITSSRMNTTNTSDASFSFRINLLRDEEDVLTDVFQGVSSLISLLFFC